MSKNGHLFGITTKETYVPLNPLQGADLILQTEIHDILFYVVKEAESSHAVGDIDHDDVSAFCNFAGIVTLVHPASRQVGTSVHPNQHGTLAFGRRSEDGEPKAILALFFTARHESEQRVQFRRILRTDGHTAFDIVHRLEVGGSDGFAKTFSRGVPDADVLFHANCSMIVISS